MKLSRAVEYELDTILMTATKVWEFVHPDSLYSPSISGVQRLPNGNTLIDFGNLQWINSGSIVTEVDSNNQIVFQLEYDNGGNLYRAQKFEWFFHMPNSNSWDCLANSCIDLGTGLGLYADSLDCVANCLSPNSSWDCVGISCEDPGNGFGLFSDSLDCVINCSSTYIINSEDIEKNKLIKIVNVFGQETEYMSGVPLFYFFNDGEVKQKIIIE